MAHYDEFIRAGSSKGMPRAMHAFYESLEGLIDDEGGFLADYIQIAVLYPGTPFTTPLPQYVAIAPWKGEITQLAIVNQRSITGGPSVVSFKIDGGAAISTLSTGAGVIGETDIDHAHDATPYPFLEGEVLTAEADGAATGLSEIMVFATIRSVAS